MVVEEVTTRDRVVDEIRLRPEAMPFFASPTPLWPWRPRTDSGTHQQRGVLDWYLEVG